MGLLLMEFRSIGWLQPYVGSAVFKVHRHGGAEEEPRWPGCQLLPDILAPDLHVFLLFFSLLFHLEAPPARAASSVILLLFRLSKL